MSTYTFADQVLGLAREYKKELRRIERMCKRGDRHPGALIEKFQKEFHTQLLDAMTGKGYYHPDAVDNFYEALHHLVDSSTPEYKHKEK